MPKKYRMSSNTLRPKSSCTGDKINDMRMMESRIYIHYMMLLHVPHRHRAGGKWRHGEHAQTLPLLALKKITVTISSSFIHILLKVFILYPLSSLTFVCFHSHSHSFSFSSPSSPHSSSPPSPFPLQSSPSPLRLHHFQTHYIQPYSVADLGGE